MALRVVRRQAIADLTAKLNAAGAECEFTRARVEADGDDFEVVFEPAPRRTSTIGTVALWTANAALLRQMLDDTQLAAPSVVAPEGG